MPNRSALSAPQVIARLASLDGWRLHGDGDDVAIEKTFSFDTYLQTLAFANAVAYMAEKEDHHPEMLITFGRCSVRFNTHDVGGISVSDFACAAKVDALHADVPPP